MWMHHVAAAPAQDAHLYGGTPNHLWDRVHRLFYERAGADGPSDDVDPLLWRETKHLLTGPSHAQAVRLLDEFLDTGGEKLIADPLKRAVFQHDLWAVFDWLVEAEANPTAREALMVRVARVMRRVAISKEEIERLPDNYAAAIASGALPDRFDPAQRDRAFLSRDLLAAGGSWMEVGGNNPAASQHAAEIGRSAFSIRWRLPEGEAATLEYFRTLWDVADPFVLDRFVDDGERRVALNPSLPPPPSGTHIALVRSMLLVDRTGAIVPAPLTEKIQLRVVTNTQPAFFEIRMRRRRLFGGEAGGLEAIRPGDRAYLTFSSKGMDPLEVATGPARAGEILQGCPLCHQLSTPVESVLSIRRLLRPQTLVDPRHPRWGRWFTQRNVAAERKSQRAEWGRLQGIWQSTPR